MPVHFSGPQQSPWYPSGIAGNFTKCQTSEFRDGKSDRRHDGQRSSRFAWTDEGRRGTDRLVGTPTAEGFVSI